MTSVERLTVEIMRLTTIMERVEPRLSALEDRMLRSEVRDAWRMGAAAAVGAVTSLALPALMRAVGL